MTHDATSLIPSPAFPPGHDATDRPPKWHTAIVVTALLIAALGFASSLLGLTALLLLGREMAQLTASAQRSLLVSGIALGFCLVSSAALGFAAIRVLGRRPGSERLLMYGAVAYALQQLLDICVALVGILQALALTSETKAHLGWSATEAIVLVVAVVVRLLWPVAKLVLLGITYRHARKVEVAEYLAPDA